MAEPLILRIDVDDKGMPKIKALHGELGKLNKGVKDSDKHMAKWERSLKKVKDTLFSMKTALAAVAGAYAALRIVRMVKGWMDLAGAQEAAEASLKQVMVSMGRYSDEFFAATKKQASALQVLTGVGDETILQGQKFLFTFKQISDEAMPRATKTMLDLAALMGGDVQRAAITLGKASMGLRGELTRMGITIGENTYAQKGFLGMLEEIEKQVKAQAVTFRKTWLGSLMALRNEIGDFKEEFGKAFILTVQPAIENVISLLQDLKSTGRLDEWSKSMAEAVVGAVDIMLKAFFELKKAILGIRVVFGGVMEWITGRELKNIEKQIKTATENIRQAQEPSILQRGLGKLGFAGLTEEDRRKQIETSAEQLRMLKERRTEYETMQKAARMMAQDSAKEIAESQKELVKLSNAIKDIETGWDESSKAVKGFGNEIKNTGNLMNETKGKTEAWRNEISRSTKEMADLIENELEPDIISLQEHLSGFASEVVREMDPAMKEIQRLWIEGWDNMEDHFVYSWSAMMRSGVDDFGDAMDAVYGIFRNTMTRIVSERLFRDLSKAFTANIMKAVNDVGMNINLGGISGLKGFLGAPLPGFSPVGPEGPVQVPTWGTAIGGVGAGLMGSYMASQMQVNIPQRGAYGAGYGAIGGLAVGGPFGMTIGGMLGGLASVFGKKEPVPEMKVHYTIDEEGFRRTMDYWGGGLERSQEVVNEIERVLGVQYSNYTKMAIMTESNLSQMKVNIDALGRTEIRDIGEMIAQIPAMFALENLSLFEELFPGRTAEMQELTEAIRAQEEAISAYNEASARRTQLSLLAGPWAAIANIFESRQIVSQMQAELSDLMDQLAGGADVLMQEFLEYETNISQMLGSAFSGALQTRQFSDFERGFKSMLAESVKSSLAQQVFNEIGQQALRRMWDIYQADLGGMGQGFTGIIDYMASMIMQGALPSGEAATAKIEQLTDVLGDFRPAFDNLTATMEMLEAALGLNTEVTDSNTGAISEYNELLERQRRIEEFMTSLTTGQQAPVQSLEAIEGAYRQLLRTDEDLTQLFSYITSTYLPFMQAYGDYATTFSQVIEDIKGLSAWPIVTSAGMQTEMEMPTATQAMGQTQMTVNPVISTSGIETVLSDSFNDMFDRLENLKIGPLSVSLNIDGRKLAEIIAMELEAGNSRLTNAIRKIH